MYGAKPVLSSFVVCISLSVVARAEVITFLNDYEGFLAAAGDVHEIDFETLPDGSPSYDWVPITPEFNYTDQGVTFSSPYPVLQIGNEFQGHYSLEAQHEDSSARNWIIGDFVAPASAVGIFFPGGTTLSVFDVDGILITDAYFGASGWGHFLGIVSDVPIHSAIGDRGSSGETFESFLFTPVPEPGTALLALLGGAILMRRRRR